MCINICIFIGMCVDMWLTVIGMCLDVLVDM